MAGRYPNTLFHFTEKREALFGILADNFHLNYVREKLISSQQSFEFLTPMVSFCDLRLSEVADHMKDYGRYGIGMSKTWAATNGLNPVAYWSKHCHLTNSFIHIIKDLTRHIESIQDMEVHLDMTRLLENTREIYRYIKNYEGDLIREGKETRPNFRFANEREWRYAPPWEGLAGKAIVEIEGIRPSDEKTDLNALLIQMRLKFEPDDISYLIVEHESDRRDIIDHIQSVKKKKYSPDSITILSSRILTAQQIIDDV